MENTISPRILPLSRDADDAIDAYFRKQEDEYQERRWKRLEEQHAELLNTPIDNYRDLIKALERLNVEYRRL